MKIYRNEQPLSRRGKTENYQHNKKYEINKKH